MPNRLPSILQIIVITLFVAVVPQGFADDPLPDPRELLSALARDRLAIASGRMKFEVTSASARTPDETARARLVIVFDGVRCKLDQDQRSLRIDWIGRSTSSIESRRHRLFASWGDPEMIVREGLGYWSDRHSRVIYDGNALMRYSPENLAYVKDPRSGSDGFLFHPSTLGLSTSASSPVATASKFLTPRADDVVSLVGREMVGGVSAWHVSVGDATDFERHFWVEPLPGHRLYKAEYRSRRGRSVIVSEYDPPVAGDAGRLPARVKAVVYDLSGKIDRELVVERSPEPKSVEFNVPIDPDTWTFAGLEMPIGEPVSDHRAGGKIAYWDGKALSDTVIPQPPKDAVARPRPSIAKLLEVARRDPTDPLAMDAVAAIARSDKSAPENREALGLLTRYQAGAKGVGEIGLLLADSQPKGTETLFRAILKKNPHREDQGHACFGLAEILKSRSEQTGGFGNAEAEQFLERVVSSYSDVRRNGRSLTLGESARISLSDLQTVGIGKPAPALDGMDLDGKPLRLSDYRGKVVVVVFWATWCRPCMAMVPQERELVTRMEGKPFALLGVNRDEKQSVARATREKEAMTWPSWWSGENRAPLAERWGVRFLPTVYILDARGVIRFKNLRGEALGKAVDSLME